MISLVRAGIISRDQYLEAVQKHRQEGGLLGQKLLELGYLDGTKMERFARKVLGYE